MKKYFGTDGIRGLANIELTKDLAYKIACALSVVVKRNNNNPVVLIGKDTRESCDMLEEALISGFIRNGVNVKLLGIIPTPGVAYLARTEKADAGVVISASHNTFEYNGIKVFSNKGMKLEESIENEIEELILRNEFEIIGNNAFLEYSYDLVEKYTNMILKKFDNLSSNLKIAIDAANGSTFKIANDIYKKLNLNTVCINNIPNGRNINENCGSTNLENLKKFVLLNKMDIGIAYDGDGDRCLAVDRFGNEIDGDAFLCVIGEYLYRKGKLKDNTIVATVMSNLGLNEFAQANGIKIIQTKVGDKYVLDEILKKNLNFGGEQSGHIILYDYNPTGDGIMTSLMLMKVLQESGIRPEEIFKKFIKFPQILINVDVDSSKKYDYNKNKEINTALQEVEKEFSGKGRVLIRASGTEPKIRVMIEGKDKEYIREKAEEIARIIEQNLK